MPESVSNKTKIIGCGVVATILMVAVILVMSVLLFFRVNALDSILSQTTTPKPDGPAPTTTTRMPPVGHSQAWMDAAHMLLGGLNETVDPCDNFYGFTCEKWKQDHPLVGGQAGTNVYSMSQRAIIKQLQQRLADVNPSNMSWPRAIATTALAYESCIHSSDGNYMGAKTILKVLHDNLGFPAIDAGWNASSVNSADIWGYMGRLINMYGSNTFMQPYVSVDWRNIDRNALYLYQGTLGLGVRDFYVKDNFAGIIANYKTYLASLIMQLANDSSVNITQEEAMMDANMTVEFEIKLAKAIVPDDQMRIAKELYNANDLGDLQANPAYQGIDWMSMLEGILGNSVNVSTLQTGKRIILISTNYSRSLAGILGPSVTPRNVIVNYLNLRFVMDNMDFMGETYRSLKLEMKKSTEHIDLLPPSQLSCAYMMMSYIPYAIGRLYINDYPNLAAIRSDVAFQSQRIITAFGRMVSDLKWMDFETKLQAARKANGLIQNIAYPDWITNDQKLDDYHSMFINLIQNGSGAVYWENTNALRHIQQTMNIMMLMKASDRYDFLDSPAVVNAWYQPERNSITFPLGILNIPYYRYDFPQAINYAGQGGSAGHELTHGFDDQGVQYGSNGTMYTWMTPHSKQGFLKMAGCVVNQYSSQCCPYPHLCANGQLTQGENIADVGGMAAAYYAYQDYVADYGMEKRLPGLAKYSMNQIFWISYGYTWCENLKKSLATQLLLTNPHAPAKCRVNEVLRDIPEFGRDFNCRRGKDYMYPDDAHRCQVW